LFDQRLKLRRKLIVAAVLLLVLASVAGVYSYYLSEKPPSVQLRVFAAASLTHVVQDNESVTAFEQENNVKILVNLAGSDALYQQIYSGSPADVYLAADSSWLTKLNQNGLLYNSQYWNFTSNVLVVIVPLDNPRSIESLLDLAQPGVRIAVCAWTVPAGKYTNITLTKIDKTWATEASSSYKGPEWKNYRDRVIANVITYETTVEHVVGKVLTGTVDAGFAYMSDAVFLGQSKLKYVQIPSDVNIQAAYGIGVLKESSHYDLATKYLNFWLSQMGQDLLAKYGFGSVLSTTPILTDGLLLQATNAGIGIQVVAGNRDY
jgi:molybdate transport system substrate-binding protein